MDLIIVIAALCLLMFVAYKGYSVILFAPIVALAAIFLTNPHDVAPMYTGLFMEKMVGFIKNYFPVFLLGAVFGKVIEISGFSKSIVSAIIKLLGSKRAILAIVLVCNVLTYGGVSLFVVVFAVYPFAAEMFRQSNIPKRLIPGTIALGAFAYTMDSIPGTPQIQNVIPTSYFGTNIYAAPVLGILGAIFILVIGIWHLESERRKAEAKGEGYGEGHTNEPEPFDMTEKLMNPWVALLPLVLVGVMNKVFTDWIPTIYGETAEFIPAVIGDVKPTVVDVHKVSAIWAVEGALVVGILAVVILGWKHVVPKFAEASKAAVGGALLSTMNTASEYGFGGVIAALPGFLVVADALRSIPNPLVNEAITVSSLAGITGSASGGMGIALAAMSDFFVESAHAHNIPLEVFHRVAAMASGGMDTLPHNGAVITLLAVCGLTHKQAYKDIFFVTLIKTAAVFFVIAIYYATGLV
jgi:H+/gluconate symporter-like permease